MMSDPNVVEAQVVPPGAGQGRAISLPPIGPIPPGGSKPGFVALEDCAADVVGVGSAPGSTVVKIRIGQNEFKETEAAGVAEQLAAMRPRCAKAQFVFLTVRNDTEHVQVFQPFFWIENEDRAARAVTDRAAKTHGPSPVNGSTIRGRVPKVQPAPQAQPGRKRDRAPTTVVGKGFTITSTPGPGRRHIAPVTVVRKGRHAPAQVAPSGSAGSAGGFDKRATELVLFFLERRHLVASQMIPYVMTKFAKLAEAAGDEAATLEKAIRTRTPILPEARAKAIAANIRAAMVVTKALDEGGTPIVDGEGNIVGVAGDLPSEKNDEGEKTE